MKKRFTKILLGIVLLAVIMLGCVCTAYADDKTISGLGTNGIANPTNGNGGWSQVYFGSQDTTPILFNVLKNGETNFTSSTNPTLLLDCASILEEMAFDGEEPYSNVWNGSPIQTYLNGEFKTNHFTTQEISAISPSSKQNKGNGDGNGWKQETRGLGWASLAGEQIFLLDAVEATNTSYGFPNINTGSATRVKVQKNYNDGHFVSDRDWRWWLRSPGMSLDNSGIMGEGGGFIFEKVNGYYGVSPALNVNLASVIFSSEISSKTYKLTIADTANRTVGIQEGNAVSRDSVTQITVPYTKDSGSNHVSLLITNAKNESNQDITWKSSSGWSNGAVKQYYTTAAVNGTTGTVTFPLPAGYETNKENWKVWLLAEQENEGNKTDYASTPLEIEPPACSEAATWSGLYDAFQTGGYIKLTGDVTCGTGGGTHASDAPLTVPTGKAVTLDLNGHVIDRGMSNAQSADNNNNVINVEGKMTLIDSKSTTTHSDTQLPAGGVITGGKGMDHGGGVYVDGGTFTMNGGTIFVNSARTGGGVYIYSGAFTMNGGAIRGNSASTYNGGGVYAYGGTFTMSGGLITDNRSAQQGGGVYAYRGTTFNISGSPQIMGNFKGTQNNNVYVSGSDTAIITVGVLTPYSASVGTGSHIGVSMTHGYNAVAFTTGASFANDAAAQAVFFADNSTAYEIKASDGQAKLSPYPATAPTINTQPAATTTLTSGYASGGTLTVSASAATDTTYEALAYQWYSNTTANSTGGTKISDATSSNFDIPTGLTTGNHYYYCVVAATRSDNGQSAAATSNVATVTVSELDTSVTDYPLWVGGTRVTSENASGADHPTWTYDANNNTLTLNGYTYNSDGYNGAAIYYNGDSTLKVVLSGSNTVKCTGVDTNGGSYGIYSASAVEISGNGSLTATGGPATGNEGTSGGVLAVHGNVTVKDGGMLKATGGTATKTSYGVGTMMYATVEEGGTIEATGGTATENDGTSSGVLATGGVTVEKGGTLNATGGTATGNNGMSRGVVSAYGNVTVREGGILEATGNSVAILSKVKNEIAGTGWWTNDEGETVKENIEPSSSGQSLEKYHRVQFPVAHEHNDINFKPWTSSDGLPNSADNYYLTDDVTLTDTWEVPEGETNLCLNGHGIRMNDNGSVIDVKSGSTLNLYECDTNTKHKYTMSDGLAIVNDSANSFTGGYITGGDASLFGGGVLVYGTFNMYGGTIIGNKGVWGGGVYVTEHSTFNMSGGTIMCNKASNSGSGVCTVGIFNMTDGSITNNTANGKDNKDGGGVWVSGNNATFTVSGAPKITGNKTGDKEINVYLTSPTIINVADKLTGSDGCIGVTMESDGVFTSGLSNGGENAIKKFFSDDSDYTVKEETTSGEAQLAKKEPATITKFLVTFKVKGGAWDDEGKTTADKTLEFSRDENEDKALPLYYSDFPAVGNSPDGNHIKGGTWDPEPKTEKDVRQSETYIFTYYKKPTPPKPQPTPSQKVTNLINNLPDLDKLTLANTDAVIEAMDAYNALSDAQKKQVNQKLVKKLFEAYDTIQALIVDGQIKMLPDPITISDEAIVNDTIEDYLALTDAQKALVDPVLLQKLAAADDAIATAKAKARETKVSGAKNLKGKKAKVKWKTTLDASGYQIKYSTDKKFKKGVKSKKAGKTATNATLKHLKKGKTYYVKVRPYSEIKNRITGAEKIVYGQADGMERVKIKK